MGIGLRHLFAASGCEDASFAGEDIHIPRQPQSFTPKCLKTLINVHILTLTNTHKLQGWWASGSATSAGVRL